MAMTKLENKMVIDVHAHLGKSVSIRKGEVGGVVETTPEHLIKLMSLAKIDKAIISPIPGYPRPRGQKDTMEQNDLVANAVQKYPEKFPCGLGTVEPRDGEACLDEVDRIFKDLGLKGLMFHHLFQGIYLDHPIMFAILKKASVYHPVVEVHVKEGSLLESPWRVARVAKAYPGIKFIMAHPAIDVQDLACSMDVALNHKNVYLDTCIWHHHLSPLETAVETIGADRILFGSDLPYYEGESLDLAMVKNAKIPEEAKELILSKNAIRIFDLSL
jgi:predicted TIM-barrel fold metal-dependent hydrolase